MWLSLRKTWYEEIKGAIGPSKSRWTAVFPWWILLRQHFREQSINCLIFSLPREGFWLEQPLKGLPYEVNSPKTAVKRTKRSCHTMHPNQRSSFPAIPNWLLIQFRNFQSKSFWNTYLYRESFLNTAFPLSFPSWRTMKISIFFVVLGRPLK